MSRSRLFRRKNKRSFAKRHKEYLKTLRATIQSKDDDNESGERDKHNKVADFGATLRAAILNGKSVRRFWKPAKAAASLEATRSSFADLRNVSSKQEPSDESARSFPAVPYDKNSKAGEFAANIYSSQFLYCFYILKNLVSFLILEKQHALPRFSTA